MDSTYNTFYTSVYVANLAEQKKIKVDICTLPAEVLSREPFKAKSKVADENYEGFLYSRRLKAWFLYEKKGSSVFYQIVYDSQSDSLMETEKKWLPIIKKELGWKLILCPSLRKAFYKKINKLIGSGMKSG